MMCASLSRQQEAAAINRELHSVMGFAGETVVDALILVGAGSLTVIGCCYVAMMWKLRRVGSGWATMRIGLGVRSYNCDNIIILLVVRA